MATKVTDLEKFSLEQIWRPYSGLAGLQRRPDVPPVGLFETSKMLAEDTEWSRHVLERIEACDFYFPPYIQHELVSVLGTRVRRRAALSQEGD